MTNRLLDINLTITNSEGLDKFIKFVNDFQKSLTNKDMQVFLKNKIMMLANEITDQKLTGGTTNDIYISQYKMGHKIEDFQNGFILYNDTQVVADTKDPEDYPNGKFSVALAFEYGVGIQGMGSYIDDYFTPWNYMVSKKMKKPEMEWCLPDNEDIQNFQVNEKNQRITFGHNGFEIYRTIAIETNKRLSKWVDEYIKGFEVK